MAQQEQFNIYINHIYETSLSLIQLWDTRDVNSQISYSPLIRQLVEIEKIIALVKDEMVQDASYLG